MKRHYPRFESFYVSAEALRLDRHLLDLRQQMGSLVVRMLQHLTEMDDFCCLGAQPVMLVVCLWPQGTAQAAILTHMARLLPCSGIHTLR